MKNKKNDKPNRLARTVPTLETPAGGKLLTRTEAAKACGVSTSTWIRRIEGTLIEPVMNDQNHHLFVEQEVERISVQVKAMREGQESDRSAMPPLERAVYLRVLELFDEKKGVLDVVRELALFPEEVEPIYAQWVKYRCGLFLEGQQLCNLRSYLSIRNGDRDRSGQYAHSAEEFVRLIWDLVETSDLADAQFRCKHCRPDVIRRAEYCPTCAEDRARRGKK
jgi:hypothetical protein